MFSSRVRSRVRSSLAVELSAWENKYRRANDEKWDCRRKEGMDSGIKMDTLSRADGRSGGWEEGEENE